MHTVSNDELVEKLSTHFSRYKIDEKIEQKTNKPANHLLCKKKLFVWQKVFEQLKCARRRRSRPCFLWRCLIVWCLYFCIAICEFGSVLVYMDVSNLIEELFFSWEGAGRWDEPIVTRNPFSDVSRCETLDKKFWVVRQLLIKYCTMQ